ncbi:hypothetical protein BDV93DRAFT_555180 [Ceratobasidium sp. AG-I]|nr:hypothetical protein BDV93DRAFT_555180 [Ceratobasidium sp. AG-I]
MRTQGDGMGKLWDQGGQAGTEVLAGGHRTRYDAWAGWTAEPAWVHSWLCEGSLRDPAVQGLVTLTIVPGTTPSPDRGLSPRRLTQGTSWAGHVLPQLARKDVVRLWQAGADPGVSVDGSLDGTMPPSATKHETRVEGVETRTNVWTVHQDKARLGEGVYAVEHECDSKEELMELKVKNVQRVVYADEGEHVHDCTTADDPETLVLGLSRQNDSVAQRDVRTHDIKTANIVTDSYLATNIIDTHTKCEAVESRINLP